MVMRVCKVNESQKQIIKGSVIVNIDGSQLHLERDKLYQFCFKI